SKKPLSLRAAFPIQSACERARRRYGAMVNDSQSPPPLSFAYWLNSPHLPVLASKVLTKVKWLSPPMYMLFFKSNTSPLTSVENPAAITVGGVFVKSEKSPPFVTSNTAPVLLSLGSIR